MNHTLELSDAINITGFLSRSGDNIKLTFVENINIIMSIDSINKIRRIGDTAFIRTNYP